MPGTPSDWVSGERVFAPPRGTVDVDWLVPAVLEQVPGAAPVQAREALVHAWTRHRSGRAAAPDEAGAVGADPLASAAERVLAEALDTFGS